MISDLITTTVTAIRDIGASIPDVTTWLAVIGGVTYAYRVADQ